MAEPEDRIPKINMAEVELLIEKFEQNKLDNLLRMSRKSGAMTLCIVSREICFSPYVLTFEVVRRVR